MTDRYKGIRITELLEDIALWQSILESSRGEASNLEEVNQMIEGEATLAIMKAKLTSLQGV